MQIQNLGHNKSMKNGCVCSWVFKMTGVRQPTMIRLPSNQKDRGSPNQFTIEAMIRMTTKSKVSAGVKVSRSILSRGRSWTEFSKVRVLGRFELKITVTLTAVATTISPP